MGSSTAFGNGVGVTTSGSGCMKIEDLMAYANDDDGLSLESSGTVQLSSITANGNGSDGGLSIRVPKDETLAVGGEDITAIGNTKDGIHIDEEDADGKTAGTLTAAFKGSITLDANSDDGIENRNELATVTFYDTLNANGNSKEGLDAREGSLVLTSKATVTACGNDIDVRNDGFLDENLAVTCDTRQAVMSSILCPGDCPAEGTATTC